MALCKKIDASTRPVSAGATLLVLGLLVGGSLLAVGSWAFGGMAISRSVATPTLSDAYGEQFLLTNSQLAPQRDPREASGDGDPDSTVSPLKNWSYTRTLRHVSPAH